MIDSIREHERRSEEQRTCPICGNPSGGGRCDSCWDEIQAGETRLSEAQFQRQVLEAFERAGILAFPYYQPHRRRGHGYDRRSTGVADILGCHAGRFFAVELKTKEGRISDEQRSFLNRALAAGGKPWVARTMEDIESILVVIRGWR